MKLSHSLLAASLLASPALAQGGDECADASPLTGDVPVAFDTTTATLSSEVWPCAATGGPDLWFSYTTTLGMSSVSFQTCGSSYDTALEVFSGDCGALTSVICNDDACVLQSIAEAPSNAAGTTFYVRIGGFNGSTGAGTIVATETDSSMGGCSMPDMFEDNDDCPTAAPISDGSYFNLNVEEFDNDYFAVNVPAGGTLTAEILFTNATADLDLYLWDPLVACDTNVAGTGTGSGALVVGFSASDDEQIGYTNVTGATQSLILEVDMFTVGGCNSYDLFIDGAGDGDNPIGTNYCMANPNTTGMVGVMSGQGSTVVADNDVTIIASQLPTDSLGVFCASQTQGFTPNPGGSEGNLCLAGNIGRYVGPGQVQSSGAAGEISITVDLTMQPTSNGMVQVMAGETWNYQAWHRDRLQGGVATSNFTDGLSISYK